MANSQINGSKSDPKMNRRSGSCLEKAVLKIEERRGNLTNRQQYLKEKICALERSIPALMAFNMWTLERNCDEAPLYKIRRIMEKISPSCDPTEKLMENLKNAVTNLNAETAELHEKIIAADVEIEESEMELESLERANKEFEDIQENLEKKLKSIDETPSLRSIHSEDLFCLDKIRRLGEEEMNLKNSIKELEERENLFQEQLNRILECKDFQNSICYNECEKIIQVCPAQTNNEQEMKKKTLKTKQFETPKGTDLKSVGASTSRNVDTGEIPTSGVKNSTQKKMEPGKEISKSTRQQRSIQFLNRASKSHSSSMGEKSNVSRKHKCAICCKGGTTSRWKHSKEKKPCDKNSTMTKAPLGVTCKKCQGLIIPREYLEERGSSSRRRCPNKVTGAKTDSCNCSQYLEFLNDEEHQPIGDSTRFNDQSSTDEEYGECCDCGCEDSEFSDSF